ncbi:MAG: hypothetical protein AAF335_02780, partial [Bacteroidota bacterium]
SGSDPSAKPTEVPFAEFSSIVKTSFSTFGALLMSTRSVSTDVSLSPFACYRVGLRLKREFDLPIRIGISSYLTKTPGLFK